MRRWFCFALGSVALAVLAQGLPAPWQSADIGDVTVPGWSAANDAGIQLGSAGADIWSVADAFRYAWQPLAGDGALTATVTRIDRSDDWAKAGVMIRESTSPGSPYVYVCVTPRNGVNMQYRPAQGAEAREMTLRAQPGAVPVEVHLDRAGDSFAGYYRAAGGEWVGFGQVTVPMKPEALAGLAVTSHAYKISTVGGFRDVVLRDR